MRFIFWVHFMGRGGGGGLFWWSPSPAQTLRVFISKFPKDLGWSVQLYVRRGKMKLKQISSNDCGTKKILSLHTSELSRLTCLTSSCDAFLYIQLYPYTASPVATFGYSPLRTTNSACNVPGHGYDIYSRFTEGESGKNTISLRLFDSKKKKPDDDGVMKKWWTYEKDRKKKKLKHEMPKVAKHWNEEGLEHALSSNGVV